MSEFRNRGERPGIPGIPGIPGESEKEFRNLERIWNEAYDPKNDSMRHMVTELVNADWLLQRATRTYLDIEAKLFAKSTNPLDWTEEEQRTLGRFQRYKTAAANHMARCKKSHRRLSQIPANSRNQRRTPQNRQKEKRAQTHRSARDLATAPRKNAPKSPRARIHPARPTLTN
jgi:hypothetical protein